MAGQGVDELFEVKNAFYLGDYQKCIVEAQKCRPTAEGAAGARDAFLYRAYVCQRKFAIPLDEISPAAANGMQALRMYADYMAHENKRSGIVGKLEERVNAGVEASDSLFFLMAAHIYLEEGNTDAALRMLHQADDLECQAMTVECLLKIDRVDMAVKEVKKLQERDEDATITQLAMAWTNMAFGREKLQDAFYIYQEMIDKYGETPLLLVAQAACLIQQQKYEQAESLLGDALRRDPNYPQALVNMILVSQYLGKPLEQCNRYISQLKEGHPNHPFTRDYTAKEALFDRLAASS